MYGLTLFIVGDIEQAAGPIANANDFAFILAALLPFHIELAYRQPRARAFWVLTFAVSLATIAATLSRGALVGLGVAALWLLATRRATVSGVLSVLAVACVLVGVGLVFASDAFDLPLQHKRNIGASNIAAREAYWAAAIQMGLDHPLTGVGPGRFPAEAGAYDPNEPTVPERGPVLRDSYPVVHNSYLDVFAEIGVLALLAFVAFLGSTWRLLSDVYRRAQASANAQIARFVTAMQCGLVIAVVSGTFLSIQLSTPFWIFGAMASSVALLGLSTQPRA
jgi:putative inorganic carbon (hco3(-)) transporter